MAVNRITGITSGIDTDATVKKLMKIEQQRYDKVDQEKQYAEWKQEGYRTTIDVIKKFQSKYFDVLNREHYLQSSRNFAAFSSTVLLNGEESKHVSVTGSANMKQLSHEIGSITKLARKDQWFSKVSGISAISSGEITSDKLTSLKANGISFNLSIDGSTKKIDLPMADLTSVSTIDDLVAKLNTKIGEVFGSEFNDMVSKNEISSGKFGLQFKHPGSNLKLLKEGDSKTLETLDIKSGTSNTSYGDKKLKDLFGADSSLFDNLKVNGKKIEGITENTSLNQFMDIMNKSGAGIKLTFNSLDDRFILESENTGALNNIDFSESDDAKRLFGKMGFDTTGAAGGDGSGGAAYRVKGENAVFNLDGHEVVKSSNDFYLDGVSYSLKSTFTPASGDPKIEIKFTNDVDKIVERIQEFVKDYNDLIKKIDLVVREKPNSDYKPLSAEQKKGMEKEEIEKWETEAKRGILYRESHLSGMLDKMRMAFYESVEGADTNLTQIGITTSDKYKDRGKLVVDETKLKDALTNNYQAVVELFTKESDKSYLDEDNKTERYKENGITHKLDDILKDLVRTSRDKNGKKGLLIEKAGLKDDASDKTNTLTKELEAYDVKLKRMMSLLLDKENAYYQRFAKMETALTKLASQSASLTQSLGG
jgi:flagellar hook-associated protein 2